MHAAPSVKIDGRELFTREWIASDPRSHGGDGLGPMFNDTSCVACHNQAGVGGAGPEAKNARIVTVVRMHSGNDPFGPSDPTTEADSDPATFPQSTSLDPFGAFPDGDASQDDSTSPVPGAQTSELAPPTEAAFGSALTKSIATMSSRNARARASNRRLVREREELEAIHPGFGTVRSLVLHTGSTDPAYLLFRDKFGLGSQFAASGGMGMPGMMTMPGMGMSVAMIHQTAEFGPNLTDSQVNDFARRKMEVQLRRRNSFPTPPTIGNFTFIFSERNTPALFGSGKIDTIPDQVLIEAAAKKYRKFPEIKGRVARLQDGRIGRFGWKAQKASLRDFVFTACAVELGLEVPGEHQAALPHKPGHRAPGLDLNEVECNELVRFVASLPAPKAPKVDTTIPMSVHVRGQQLFAAIGCAACHTPQLGDVSGIYSDLLLHDMGSETSDSGSYGVFLQDSSEEDEHPAPDRPLASAPQNAKSRRPASGRIGATRQEWRTPPLWGLRDSAPYLHDGRAENLEQAIAMHGGEGLGAARRFFHLAADEQLQLVTFLRSLTASH